MPYNKEQCKLFGAKSSKGEKVPKDWKQHCKKGKTILTGKKKKK